MNILFKRIMFYHKAMNLAPYHFAPKEFDTCPYIERSYCPIWNCVFHFDSLEPNARYCKSCNFYNLIKKEDVVQIP